MTKSVSEIKEEIHKADRKHFFKTMLLFICLAIVLLFMGDIIAWLFWRIMEIEF